MNTLVKLTKRITGKASKEALSSFVSAGDIERSESRLPYWEVMWDTAVPILATIKVSKGDTPIVYLEPVMNGVLDANGKQEMPFSINLDSMNFKAVQTLIDNDGDVVSIQIAKRKVMEYVDADALDALDESLDRPGRAKGYATKGLRNCIKNGTFSTVLVELSDYIIVAKASKAA